MPAYKDAEHLYECIGGLFDRLGRDPVIGQKLRESELVLRFIYTEPDAVITINCNQPSEDGTSMVRWMRGEADLEPIVTMSMKADVAHSFWLGKVNLPFALMKKKIVAKGPIPKLLKLLPVIKPAYAMYPKLLQEKGYSDMIEWGDHER